MKFEAEIFNGNEIVLQICETSIENIIHRIEKFKNEFISVIPLFVSIQNGNRIVKQFEIE